jgi:ABC-type lipoprotein export system ATPase subunit
MNALEARDLDMGYTSGKLRTDILRGLSLTVEAGQLTLIAGPSGCGKSTLLSILSGLQRPDAGVAIARALVKQPQLLFADEPTSALDAANGQIVIDTLRRIAHEHDTTVLCVSHDPRLVTHADRVLEMEDGMILNDRRVPHAAAPRQERAS